MLVSMTATFFDSGQPAARRSKRRPVATAHHDTSKKTTRRSAKNVQDMAAGG